MKMRLDKLLVDRGLTLSRGRAQALILAGRVLVNEQKIEKAGASIDADSALRLLGDDLRYVSRGGLKLEKAIEHWQINLDGKVCLDIGASTGGFSDCMLRHGARTVIAVDTGYGQMDFGLRNDLRIRLLEKMNARYLKASDLRCGDLQPDKTDNSIDFIAVDVSFISATLVLPAVIHAAFCGSETGNNTPQIVVLVKPQFEAGRELVGKGGIVRNESVQRMAVAKVKAILVELGCAHVEWIESPIRGSGGNREFLLHAEFLPGVRS
jgi:23S rRNA (cytidine1920-2'-O)/16S rRNA (cytidine1409-2'-O)-methyltransferase